MVNGQSLNGLIRQIVLAIPWEVGEGMELQIQNGDYVPDGLGGFRRLTGARPFCSGSCSAWSRGGGFPLYAGAGQPPLSGAPGETGSPTGAGGAVCGGGPGWRERTAGDRGIAGPGGDRGLLTVRLDWQGRGTGRQTLL